jgi:hypothetical protein
MSKKNEVKVNKKEMVTPAVIIAPQIGTPDNKLFAIMSPFSEYEDNISNNDPIITENYSLKSLPNNIFSHKLFSTIKMLCITAFNLVNNPVGDCDRTLYNINGHSVYDCDDNPLYNREPSRNPQELFTTRETLDMILNNLDQYIYRQCCIEQIDETYMYEYSVYVLSCIYDMCLNRIDCEKDIVNFNRFMNSLSYTLPKSLVAMVKEYSELYKDRIIFSSKFQQIEFEEMPE